MQNSLIKKLFTAFMAIALLCGSISALPVGADGGDAICVMDQVRDTKNTDELWTERIALKDALRLLDDRERRILSLRFYEGKTQMEVSAEVGISQAQVSRLEKGAINTIKKNI